MLLEKVFICKPIVLFNVISGQKATSFSIYFNLSTTRTYGICVSHHFDVNYWSKLGPLRLILGPSLSIHFSMLLFPTYEFARLKY